MTTIRSHNEDRRRRAESWLAQSRKDVSDDEKFIFLWIAFNAAYGRELVDETPYVPAASERNKFQDFLQEILNRDHDKTIENFLFNGKFFSNEVRKLLQNKFVYEQYWQAIRRDDTEPWEPQFTRHNDRVFRSFEPRETHGVLKEVLVRLYTLRNQIFHGGTTFATGRGRDQIKDGSAIMAALVPAILDIMRADIEANPDSEVWGKVAYPRDTIDG